MQLSALAVGIVVLLVGTRAVFSFLAIRNVQYADQLVARRREWLESTLGIDDSDELRDYHRLTTAIGELESWIGLAAVVVVVYGGGLSWVVNLLAATGL